VMMTNHLILLNEVCKAYPQEWAALVPALEYLYETAPRAPHGISAFDLTRGYALISDVDKQLAPFEVPPALPETETVQKMFKEFRELHGIFTRMTAHEAERKQEELNRKRSVRVFERGETVFRKKPLFARDPKHLMGEPVSGPYMVEEQRTLSSVILRDLRTRELVDGGACIPVDQILAGPMRSKLEFPAPSETEVRGWSHMLRGTGAPLAGRAGQRGIGRKRGWSGLGPGSHVAYQTRGASRELTIGKVLRNNKNETTVLIHPYKGLWRQMRVIHLPLYRKDDGELTVEPTARRAEAVINYSALVLVVELLRSGELMHS